MRFGIESVHARWDSKITTGITGTISLRTSCALYLVVVVVARETVRFEDEDDFMKEIWLKVFSRILKKRQPWKLYFTFFSPEKLTRLFLLMKVQPSPDRHRMIKLPTLITCSPPTTTFSLKLVVERRRLSRFPAKMTLVRACALLGVEKISLVVVVVLESFNKWQEFNNEATTQFKN